MREGEAELVSLLADTIFVESLFGDEELDKSVYVRRFPFELSRESSQPFATSRRRKEIATDIDF